jgi:hypothetical protein
VQNNYDIEQPGYGRRHPDVGGETLCASLPGMRIYPVTHPFDFRYLPQNSRIEVKYRSHPNQVHSAGGTTLQFSWNHIRDRKFDWLLLTGENKGQWNLWLLPASIHEHFMSKTNGGQITCTVNGVNKPREKALEFLWFRVTREGLYADCLNGSLGSTWANRI